MTISDIASIFGIIGGVLGTLSYFRDRAKVVVTLKWDMAVTENSVYDSNKLWGVVTVTNVGRRPIFISHAFLDFGKRYDHIETLAESISGKKLAESDPPAIFMINQDKLEEYAKDWRKILAHIHDSTGKVYHSKKVDKHKIPSWVMITTSSGNETKV